MKNQTVTSFLENIKTILYSFHPKSETWWTVHSNKNPSGNTNWKKLWKYFLYACCNPNLWLNRLSISKSLQKQKNWKNKHNFSFRNFSIWPKQLLFFAVTQICDFIDFPSHFLSKPLQNWVPQLTVPGNFWNWEPNLPGRGGAGCWGFFQLSTFHLSFTYQFRVNFSINFLDRVKNEFFRCRIRFFRCFDSYSSLHPKSHTSHFGNPSKILQEINFEDE